MLSATLAGNNLVAVFLAAAANLALGFLWYSPSAFGRPWQKLAHASAKKRPTRPIMYLFPLLTALVMSVFLLEIMVAFQISHTLDGAVLGAFIGVGFVLTIGAVQALFENRPLSLYLINYGYHFLGLMLIGAVLGAWL